MSKKELAKKNEESQQMIVHDDYGQYAGQGLEDLTRDDLAIPFLGIVQSNSPIIEVVATARPGMLVNTVTKDVYDGKRGVLFLPVKVDKYIVEWRPREQGGGFVKMHAVDDPQINAIMKDQEWGKFKVVKGDPKSNDLIDTKYVYGILSPDDGSAQQIVIAFTSTKIKAYKAWMTKSRAVQIKRPSGKVLTIKDIPSFALKWRITTVKEKNTKGEYYNFDVKLEGKDSNEALLPTDNTLFEAAAHFYQSIKEGTVKAAHDSQTVMGDEPETEVPFK